MTDADDGTAILVRLPRSLKARLRADAGRHDRSMNEHAVAIIDAHTPPLEDHARPVAS